MYSVANFLRTASSFDGLGARLPHASRLAPFEPGSYADIHHHRHRHAHGSAPPTLPPPPPLPRPPRAPDPARRSQRPYEYVDRSMFDPLAVVDPVAAFEPTSLQVTSLDPNPAASAQPAPGAVPRRRSGGPRMRK